MRFFFVYPLLIPFTAARRRANRTRRLKNKSVNPRTSPWGNKSIKISFQKPEKTSFVFPQQSFFAYVFGLTNSKDDDRLKNERFGKLINLSFFFFGFSSCIIEYYWIHPAPMEHLRRIFQEVCLSIRYWNPKFYVRKCWIWCWMDR